MLSSFVLTALALTRAARQEAAPEPADTALSVLVTSLRRHDPERQWITVRVGESFFTRCTSEGGAPPYLWPLEGPTGERMTRGFPMEPVAGEPDDHPHHRSLWFAHGAVNGHDFWHGAKTRIEPDGRAEIVVPQGERGVVRTRYRWLDDGGQLVCTETRTTSFSATASERTIDFEIALEPAAAPLVLGDTKEGSFAVRLRPELCLKGEGATGHFRNSAGNEDGDCWGKRAAWCTSWGTVEGEVVGLTLFDHPKNHAHPTWWHARDYGLFAANPFGAHDFEGAPEGTGELTVPVGEHLTLRYRLVLYAGAPDFERIEAAYGAWARAE